MSEVKTVTITELAEVIAEQNAEIRELNRKLDEQTELLVEYELDQEEEEKVGSALANDLMDALDAYDDDQVEEFRDIFSRYFGELEE